MPLFVHFANLGLKAKQTNVSLTEARLDPDNWAFYRPGVQSVNGQFRAMFASDGKVPEKYEPFSHLRHLDLGGLTPMVS